MTVTAWRRLQAACRVPRSTVFARVTLMLLLMFMMASTTATAMHVGSSWQPAQLLSSGLQHLHLRPLDPSQQLGQQAMQLLGLELGSLGRGRFRGCWPAAL